MPNQVFDTLLDDQIEIFKTGFEMSARRQFVDPATGRLIHAGEFGAYREAIVKRFLRYVVPGRLDIDQGFLMNDAGNVSSQCDVIIYSKDDTPLIQSGDCQRFFPVETVVAVGEVKSIMTRSQLSEALNKLAQHKIIRDGITAPNFLIRGPNLPPGIGQPFNPSTIPFDGLVTFVVCENFSFDIRNEIQDLHNLYDSGIEKRHFHNMILSIRDGLILYYNPEDGRDFYFPYTATGVEPAYRLTFNNEQNMAIKKFAAYMNGATSSMSALYPEIVKYFIAGQSVSVNQNVTPSTTTTA